MGFEPSINQRLLPPTFPRFICIQTFESTLNELNRFINDYERVLEIIKMKNYYQIFVSNSNSFQKVNFNQLNRILCLNLAIKSPRY